MPNRKQQTVLVLGGSGRFGRNASRAYADAGWHVRQFDRARDDLMDAARGADVIVAAWNPEYHKWADLLPDMHAKIRAAALANDATVIVPGNVYVFGEQTPAPWGEKTPHGAKNPLGRLRIEMEAAYKRDGVRTIVLRAGDYIDTIHSGNWFDLIMIKKLGKGVFTYPGRSDIAHAWGYLPDLARAAVQLSEKRAQLARFEDIPFPGYTLTGDQIAEKIAEVTGGPVKLRKMAWGPLRLVQPFMPTLKGLFEMRYLWNTPHHLNADKFNKLLPDFSQTPVNKAIKSAL
ncbi:MAG: epimerase [Rhodobacterales bacterium]|nr:epimerase [Rhodobacterales bacterium]